MLLSHYLALTSAYSLPLPTTLVYTTLFLFLCLCARTLFPGKISTLWKMFYPFVTEHLINLSPGWNLRFNNSICCHSLVLSVRPQRHSAMEVFGSIYFGWWSNTNNFILFFINKKRFYFFLFIFWHTPTPPSFRIQYLTLFKMLYVV